MQNTTGYDSTYTTIVHQHFHPEASNKSIFRLNSLRIIPGICRFLHSHLAPPWRRERPRHMTLIATSPRNILQLIPKNANIAPWSHSKKKKTCIAFQPYALFIPSISLPSPPSTTRPSPVAVRSTSMTRQRHVEPNSWKFGGCHLPSATQQPQKLSNPNPPPSGCRQNLAILLCTHISNGSLFRLDLQTMWLCGCSHGPFAPPCPAEDQTPHRFLRQTCKEGSSECFCPCCCEYNYRVQKKHHAIWCIYNIYRYM